MRDQNSYALDTRWEAAILNIKLGGLHVLFMLDTILLPFTLQSLSDTLFLPYSCIFSRKAYRSLTLLLFQRGQHFWLDPALSPAGRFLYSSRSQCTLWSCSVECRLLLQCLEIISVFMHMDSIIFVLLYTNLVQISSHYITFL